MAMRVVSVLVCLLIVAMDVAAGVLAIQAQAARDKAIEHPWCEQLSSGSCSIRAFRLALVAAVLLALAHIISNLLGGCTCVCSMEELERSSGNRKFWFACLVSSWIVAAIGLPMVIIGMLENSKLRSDGGGGGGCCRTSRHHHQQFLSTGGVLCFVHAFLSFSVYCSSVVSFRKLTNADSAVDNSG